MTKDPRYPDDWEEIATRIKEAAGWKCERCAHDHDVASGHVLTVHHLDGDTTQNADWNLAALCQRCHLHFQDVPLLGQLTMLRSEPWLDKHREGYLASLEAKP